MNRYLVRPDHDNGWDDQQHFVYAGSAIEAIKFLHEHLFRDLCDNQKPTLGRLVPHPGVPTEDEICDHWSVWEIPAAPMTAGVLGWPDGEYFLEAA
jgi:hypothetical protein